MNAWKPEVLESALKETEKTLGKSWWNVLTKNKQENLNAMADILNKALHEQGILVRMDTLEKALYPFVEREPFVRKPEMSCFWVSNVAVDRAYELLKGTINEPYRGPNPFDDLEKQMSKVQEALKRQEQQKTTLK